MSTQNDVKLSPTDNANAGPGSGVGPLSSFDNGPGLPPARPGQLSYALILLQQAERMLLKELNNGHDYHQNECLACALASNARTMGAVMEVEE